MASWPWNDIYHGERVALPKPEEPETYDPPERVRKCLSCTMPICIECYEHSVRYDKAKVLELILAGKRTALICKVCGVRPSTVERARRELDNACACRL